jgi:hypothetical protein
MAKQAPDGVRVEFEARQKEDGKRIGGLFFNVTADHVAVSVPEPMVLQMSREQARKLGEKLLHALDETTP